MTLVELETRCGENAMEWAEGAYDGKAGWFVRVPWLDTEGEDNPVTHVAADALEGIPWPTLKRHAIGGRDVSQFTRVCGYLSRVANWNPSKIGELDDRHKGTYSIAEPEKLVAASQAGDGGCGA